MEEKLSSPPLVSLGKKRYIQGQKVADYSVKKFVLPLNINGTLNGDHGRWG